MDEVTKKKYQEDIDALNVKATDYSRLLWEQAVKAKDIRDIDSYISYLKLSQEYAERLFLGHKAILEKYVYTPENGYIYEFTTDGYHTFDELYEHRTALFAALCNSYPEISFKSRKHHDGTMYEGMFIVEMNLDGKQISYHCEAKYWEWFKIPEREYAPEWDGHTSQDVIDRLVAHTWTQTSEIKRLKNALVHLFNTYVDSHIWVDKDGNEELSHYEKDYIEQWKNKIHDEFHIEFKQSSSEGENVSNSK